MKFDPKILHRRSIRLPGYDYPRAGAYYITVVSWQRAELFGEMVEGDMILNKFAQVAQSEWERLPRRFRHVELGEFVVMPNHAHGIIYFIEGRGTAENLISTIDDRTRRAPMELETSPVLKGLRRAPTEFGQRLHFRA